jgi:signal transduction histidine kinase
MEAEEKRRPASDAASIPSEKKLDQAKLNTLGATAFMDLIHEIRNPLNGVSTTLQLMERHLATSAYGQNPVLLAYIDGVRHEMGRLNEILREIQTVWSSDVRVSPIHIGLLIDELLRSEPLNSAKSGVRVEADIEKNCPAFDSDERLLKRALINLIKNSLEAMPDGGTLTLRGSVANANVSIEVSDTGCGMPGDIRPFTRYTTSKPAGMGLGLKIVKQIAGALGGEVGYANRPGGGTTFRLSLPQTHESLRAGRP